MAWMILNCWPKVEKLNLSCCKLTSLPSIPMRHCETIKEIDLSGKYIFFQIEIDQK